MDALVLIGLGLFLGMRHATDADHVIAVTTIVTRQRDLAAAAVTGLLWGLGHSLTVVAVGGAIIVFNVTVPPSLERGMEISVGAMVIALGLTNVAAFLNLRPSIWRRLARSSNHIHTHPHSHGDYVHTHPHGHTPEQHPHADEETPLARLDRRFGRWRWYAHLRPVVIGVVHGLAGSAAVSLLVVAAVREPGWAVAYLVVFGLGTVAGMMIVTVSIASAVRLAGGATERMSRRLGLAAGLAAVVFGVIFTYRVWTGA
jgi:high-affinity nickel-transport protein